MKPLEKRRLLHELGQRAVDYYLDTGLCVFCGADDVAGIPHDDDDVPCHVGKAADVKVTPERRAEKKRQREIADAFIRQMRGT